MTLRQAIELMKRSASAWADDRAPSMGAAISYYTVFSIAPLLLIATAVAGLVFGEDAARGAVVEQLRGLLGDSGAQAIQGLIESAAKPKDSVFATVIGFFLLLVGATTVFAELQDALDRIWRAPDRVRAGGLWALLRSRLLSFGMIMGIGFLLLVSLIVSAAIAALGHWWGSLFGGWETPANAVNFVFSFALITVLFALIYKIMPRVHIQWRDVWIGAAVTAMLFTIGKYLIGLYIGKSGVTSGFGAAGSVAVILLWVYYSAQIFLLGAEYTWVYAHTLGSVRDNPAQPVATNDVVSVMPRRPSLPSKVEPANGRLAARVASKPAKAIGVAMLLGACAATGVKMIVRMKHSRELSRGPLASAPPMVLRGR
jgi:membrane protein